KRTFIYVTHDQAEALKMSDRIAVVHDGRLQQFGPPEDIYNPPRNPFVAGFMGAPPRNLLPGAIAVDDAATRFTAPGFDYVLPARLAAAAQRAAGRAAVLGVRPGWIVVAPP